MIEYDAEIIQKQAFRLYQRAKTIAIAYGFLGLLGGAVGGGAAGLRETALIGAVVIATLIGVAIGIEKGFRLRLEAQTALCQVQIEQNTRGAA